MKKLIIFIIAILLLIIIYFQYKNYTRLNPTNPSAYDYSINNNIDVNYYDPVMIKEYYKIAYEIGTFAREQWYNYKIDVLYQDNESEQSKRATHTYYQMLLVVHKIEGKLIESSNLKKSGLSNYEIKYMDEHGLSAKEYKLRQLFESFKLQFGNKGQGVYNMQEKLNKLGYKIKVDGNFNRETESVVMEFQKKNRLFPTGTADKSTLLLMFKDTI